MADRESTTRDRPEVEDAVPAGRMLAPSETEVEAPHRPDADEVGEEPERTPKRRRWRWIVLLLAIAVAGAGAWRLLSPKEVSRCT